MRLESPADRRKRGPRGRPVAALFAYANTRTCTPADCIRPRSCGPESAVTFPLIGRVLRGDLTREAIVRGGLPRFRAPRLPRAAFSGAQPLHEVTAPEAALPSQPKALASLPLLVEAGVSDG